MAYIHNQYVSKPPSLHHPESHGHSIQYLQFILSRVKSLVSPLNDWRWLLNLLAKDVSLDKVRQPNLGLIRDVLTRGYRKDLCRELV